MKVLPFNVKISLDGKPLLVDDLGPVDTPITGGVRVKVSPDTTRAWLVATSRRTKSRRLRRVRHSVLCAERLES